ncbi:hypothetical protein ABPG75_013001 [Micractinium tetrahymenae]
MSTASGQSSICSFCAACMLAPSTSAAPHCNDSLHAGGWGEDTLQRFSPVLARLLARFKWPAKWREKVLAHMAKSRSTQPIQALLEASLDAATDCPPEATAVCQAFLSDLSLEAARLLHNEC